LPSTVIRSFAYRPEAQELEILFTTGRRYVYHDVPEEAAAALKSAFNKGRHFNRRIRDRFRFSEIVA
jgi:lysyl-tRNA synthetase class 2